MTPPQSRGIRCWWWWLNGNVTPEAITRDLEAMKAKGFSGAYVFDAGGASQRGNDDVPEGPMFGTPEWRELFAHAVREAERLDLVLGLNIQSGWNLGGPDVTPDEATKHLAWSKASAVGPGPFTGKLPKPKVRDNFYKDIAVLAWPQKITGSTEATTTSSRKKSSVQNLRIKAAFDEAGGSAPDMRHLLTDAPTYPGEEDTRLDDIVDLTSRLRPDGILDWSVPPGQWTIIRFGYTPSGAHVSTSSGKWQGRVIDPMSATHMRSYWERHVEPILQQIGDAAGKTLRYLQTDSWEGGGINWSDNFAHEFRQRRGYDPIPYLPIIAGYIVENREIGTRFLADFRKTISDCISDNHYGVFAELSRKYGMGIQPESAGPHAGPFDGLKNYGHSEIMMSEFWIPSPHRPTPERRYFVKQASSAAHIYNRPLVGAEAFTSIGPHWNDTLWNAHKPSFDHEICSGLNLVCLHTFTCSPKEMGMPGQEYFAGTHFNPNITWWDMAGEFFRYISRCQVLMQRGQFVADVLYYYGDHVPNIARLKEDDPAGALPGFDYDVINEDMLLRLNVRDGSVALPHGMSYRVLTLPDHGVLSLSALRYVHKLVLDGATVVGPKTERIVSLTGYPASEEERKRLAANLWGKKATASGEKRLGKGRMIWGKTAREVLLADGIAPDFEPRPSSVVSTPLAVQGSFGGPAFDYIHHRLDEMDYYFVSNQTTAPQMLDAVFRISGKQPELWNPMTGECRVAGAFRQESGRCTVPLELPPCGSAFVVFRSPASVETGGQQKSNTPGMDLVEEVSGPWEVSFDAECGAPGKVLFDELISWTERPEPGIRNYSGPATYRRKFDAQIAEAGQRLFLELGDVRDVGIARVRLNGHDCGVTWAPPFRVEITDCIQPSGNLLEITVANSWRNRLVADRDLPPEKRLTRTNIRVRPEWEPVSSGLFGPVRILSGESTKLPQ